MLPNTAQLILSCAYFSYNALYTRLLAELEWQSFSMDFRPLRVTNPQGQQRSTFRLQLPYRYSIPLLVVSIFLHWITSNAIFTFMSEGGKCGLSNTLNLLSTGSSHSCWHNQVHCCSLILSYRNIYTIGWKLTLEDSTGYYNELPQDGSQKHANLVVLVGFSPPAIFIGFCISLLLVLLPLLLGFRKLQGSMIISRSNSLIISAACHVSTLQKARSSYSRSISEVFDDNTFNEDAETLDSSHHWGHDTIAAISATVGESIELQPLIAEPFKHSPATMCSTSQSKQTKRRFLAEDDSNMETPIYLQNGQMSNNLVQKSRTPSLTDCRANSDIVHVEQENRIALGDSWDAETCPFLSSRTNRTSIINDALIISRTSNTSCEDSTINAGRVAVTEGNAPTDFHRPSSSDPVDSGDRPTAMRSLEADDTEDRLQAAREVEDGSNTEEDDTQFRIRLSRSRIRWGDVRMPAEFYTQFGQREVGVILGHLTFAIEEQGVTPPENHPGHVYA